MNRFPQLRASLILQSARRACQRGAASVEFALVAIVFFMILFGAIEMGRMLWTWNAAAESTRFGARLAVVCDIGDTTIVSRMIERLPSLTGANISVQYIPAGCTTASCQSVSVSLTGYTYQPIIPTLNLPITMPPFQTTLPREFMNSTNNEVCS